MLSPLADSDLELVIGWQLAVSKGSCTSQKTSSDTSCNIRQSPTTRVHVNNDRKSTELTTGATGDPRKTPNSENDSKRQSYSRWSAVNLES
ncbi:hypothetical protein CGZ80_09955 [Rhodopirellula sp. MGV]|nr:hypothetical protein CGZ80_09955 [Rhodopirellula sp. MGV]